MAKGMSTSGLLVIAVLGVVGFMLYKQSQAPAPVQTPTGGSPVGGSQQSAPGDLVGQILGAITSIGGAVDSLAQTQVKAH